MLLRLFLLFTLVPTMELWLLLALAGRLGLPATLSICVLTGIAGAHLARREGLSVLTRVRSELAEGRMPGGPLLEAALVFAGGLLLLTPGILTDLMGFSLVLPFTRRRVAAAVSRGFRSALSDGSAVRFTVLSSGPGGPTRPWSDPRDATRTDDPASDPYQDHPRLRRISR